MGSPFEINSSTKDVTLAAVGSSPNANGATLSGQVLNLEPASATQPGILTTGAQTIAGAKTFSGAATFSSTVGASNLSGTNTGDLTLDAVGASPNSNGATLTGQVLALQPASTGKPGVMTAADKTRLDGNIARLFTIAAPAAKAAGVDDVHASFAGNYAGIKAYYALADAPGANAKLDTTIEATTAGTAGNSITLAATADGSGTGSITRSGTNFTFHFEAGVTTVANFETLVAALAGGDDLFGTKTGGTGVTVLDAGAAFAAVTLANGVEPNAFPGPFTDPDVPRNLRVKMALNYDGGDVVAVGTDQFDAAQTETFTTGSNVTRIGTKIFKTVASATKAAVGANAAGATIGVGDKLGIATDLVDANGILAVDGATEAVTVDADEDAFTPTTAPDGAVTFCLLANV